MYSRAPHKIASYNRTHIIGEVTLPLLRYSNAPKVRGCRVQLQKTASMANWISPVGHADISRDMLSLSLVTAKV